MLPLLDQLMIDNQTYVQVRVIDIDNIVIHDVISQKPLLRPKVDPILTASNFLQIKLQSMVPFYPQEHLCALSRVPLFLRSIA